MGGEPLGDERAVSAEESSPGEEPLGGARAVSSAGGALGDVLLAESMGDELIKGAGSSVGRESAPEERPRAGVSVLKDELAPASTFSTCWEISCIFLSTRKYAARKECTKFSLVASPWCGCPAVSRGVARRGGRASCSKNFKTSVNVDFTFWNSSLAFLNPLLTFCMSARSCSIQARVKSDGGLKSDGGVKSDRE